MDLSELLRVIKDIPQEPCLYILLLCIILLILAVSFLKYFNKADTKLGCLLMLFFIMTVALLLLIILVFSIVLIHSLTKSWLVTILIFTSSLIMLTLTFLGVRYGREENGTFMDKSTPSSQKSVSKREVTQC